MEVPTYDKLMNPALRALGGSASIEELAEKVVAQLHLPKEMIEQPHGKGNQTELEYRLAWARTYLKKYGLITNSERGVWALTPEGVKVDTITIFHPPPSNASVRGYFVNPVSLRLR